MSKPPKDVPPGLRTNMDFLLHPSPYRCDCELSIKCRSGALVFLFRLKPSSSCRIKSNILNTALELLSLCLLSVCGAWPIVPFPHMLPSSHKGLLAVLKENLVLSPLGKCSFCSENHSSFKMVQVSLLILRLFDLLGRIRLLSSLLLEPQQVETGCYSVLKLSVTKIQKILGWPKISFGLYNVHGTPNNLANSIHTPPRPCAEQRCSPRPGRGSPLNVR